MWCGRCARCHEAGSLKHQRTTSEEKKPSQNNDTVITKLTKHDSKYNHRTIEAEEVCLDDSASFPTRVAAAGVAGVADGRGGSAGYKRLGVMLKDDAPTEGGAGLLT